MKRVKDIDEAKALSGAFRKENERIGFVPTMGYLHEGHLSLVRAAVAENDRSVVSIFVNPSQFGPREDLDTYPRDLEADFALLRREGVDAVFVPSVDQIYPEGYRTYVEVHGLQKRMCGRTRPHFFRGVCTVVLKLFNIIRPDVAYFGQKDAQQAVILKRMVVDLDLDIEMKIMPLIRDEDGLALSSRNSYFTPEQRNSALILYKSLLLARDMIAEGEDDAKTVRRAMTSLIQSEPRARIDYIVLVDPVNLDPVTVIESETLVALAVSIDEIRLIDNMLLGPRTRKGEDGTA